MPLLLARGELSALVLGNLLNGKPIGAGEWVGVSAILTELLLYESGLSLAGRLCGAKD